MTAQRMIALAMWLTAACFIVASALRGAGNFQILLTTLLAALILLRICDLEDRLKRMDDEGDTAREDAPDALLRDVLNLTRSDSAREARRHLKAKRTFGEHSQEDQ